MKYTVVGVYADNNQVCVHWVEADDPVEAARETLKMMDDDLQIAEVFEGDVNGLLNTYAVVTRDNIDEVKKST